MPIQIKGKQIEDSTLTQANMNITTTSVLTSTNATTMEYVDNAIQSGMSNMTYSNSNVDMIGENTTGSDPILAVSEANGGRVIQIPVGGIKVYINGIEVNVGVSLDCFFAPEGTGTPTPRVYGSEQQNDFLWWNPAVAGYQLENTDSVSYVYLVYTGI